MSKIDEAKEHIGALKTYLSIIVAVLLAIGAGVSKLYLDNNINPIFWVGIVILFVLILSFMLVARSMHNNIKKLRNLK
jgi:membrane protein YdbS with pleckstrin-like domain